MAADCKSAAPWSYGGSNPPLCTINFAVRKADGVNQLQKASTAIFLLVALAGMAWWTMDGGPIRTVAILLLGLFVVRVLLYTARSRYDDKKKTDE